MKKCMLLPLLCILAAACNPETAKREVPTEPQQDKILLKTCIMSSMEDISEFTSEGSITEYDLYMAVGETEHVQVQIFLRDTNALTMTWAHRHPEIEMDCRTYADFDEYKNEVLVPCDKLAPDSENVINLWLTFRTTADAKPLAKYTESIGFNSGTCRASIKINIHTGSSVLSRTPSVPVVIGIYTPRAADRKAYADCLLQHGISPYFFDGWGSDGHSINCWSSPYEYGTDQYWEYLKDERFAAVALPFVELTDVQLQESISRAKKEGIWAKSYYYLYDEPLYVANFEKNKEYADKLHALDADARVLTTFYRGPKDGPDEGEYIMPVFGYLDLGRSDIYCTVTDYAGEAYNAYKSRVRDSQQWWSYVTGWNTPGITYKNDRWEHRAVMWRTYFEGADGFLYWACNWFDSENPLRRSSSDTNLDGALVYPGKAFGVDGVVSSIRLERFVDGLEDAQLLLLYEKEHSRAEAETLLKSVYTSNQKISHDASAVTQFHKTLTGNN